MGNGGSASTAEHFETDLHFIRSNSISKFPKTATIAEINNINNLIGGWFLNANDKEEYINKYNK